MKQYTSNNQTAKLIELGLPKPIPKYNKDEKGNDWLLIESANYSIGELIEMLGVHLSSIYYIGIEWSVNAKGIECRREELVDALCEMIVKLKEEGVI